MKNKSDTGDAVRHPAPRLCMCFLLSIVTSVIYWQVTGFDFINFDDPFYVVNNESIAKGLTLDGIRWAFSTFHVTNWHPLTWLSLMADIELFGIDPGKHHLVNVIFHVLNTLLLFLIMEKMTGAFWKSSLIAALFALHPLHVESVAWISERKDVLSTFFWMLAIMSYLWYARNRSAFRYALVVFVYILGLLSKPMLVTLPIVLLLLDIWPLGRLDISHAFGKSSHPEGTVGTDKVHPSLLLKEKIPLIMLALISSGLTFYAQKTGGAVQSLEEIRLADRLVNSITAYAAYLVKMVWPVNLSVFYPFPESFHFMTVFLSVAFLLFVSLAAVVWLKKFPYVFVGWLWYLVTLVPVIGIIQVGQQSMADRYTYIPLIGIFIVAAWGLDDLAGRLRHGKAVLGAAWGIALVLLMHGTWVYLGCWKDSETLYTHALQTTGNNYLIHNNLGLALIEKGDIDGAKSHYSQSLKIRPGYVMAHCNLGNALASERKFSDAIAQYRLCTTLDPRNDFVYKNLGSLMLVTGNYGEAILNYHESLRINPHQAETYDYLGVAYSKQGNMQRAVECFQNSVHEKPEGNDAIIHLEQARAARTNSPH